MCHGPKLYCHLDPPSSRVDYLVRKSCIPNEENSALSDSNQAINLILLASWIGVSVIQILPLLGQLSCNSENSKWVPTNYWIGLNLINK